MADNRGYPFDTTAGVMNSAYGVQPNGAYYDDRQLGTPYSPAPAYNAASYGQTGYVDSGYQVQNYIRPTQSGAQYPVQATTSFAPIQPQYTSVQPVQPASSYQPPAVQYNVPQGTAQFAPVQTTTSFAPVQPTQYAPVQPAPTYQAPVQYGVQQGTTQFTAIQQPTNQYSVPVQQSYPVQQQYQSRQQATGQFSLNGAYSAVPQGTAQFGINTNNYGVQQQSAYRPADNYNTGAYPIQQPTGQFGIPQSAQSNVQYNSQGYQQGQQYNDQPVSDRRSFFGLRQNNADNRQRNQNEFSRRAPVGDPGYNQNELIYAQPEDTRSLDDQLNGFIKQVTSQFPSMKSELDGMMRGRAETRRREERAANARQSAMSPAEFSRQFNFPEQRSGYYDTYNHVPMAASTDDGEKTVSDFTMEIPTQDIIRAANAAANAQRQARSAANARQEQNRVRQPSAPSANAVQRAFTGEQINRNAARAAQTRTTARQAAARQPAAPEARTSAQQTAANAERDMLAAMNQARSAASQRTAAQQASRTPPAAHRAQTPTHTQSTGRFNVPVVGQQQRPPMGHTAQFTVSQNAQQRSAPAPASRTVEMQIPQTQPQAPVQAQVQPQPPAEQKKESAPAVTVEKPVAKAPQTEPVSDFIKNTVNKPEPERKPMTATQQLAANLTYEDSGFRVPKKRTKEEPKQTDTGLMQFTPMTDILRERQSNTEEIHGFNDIHGFAENLGTMPSFGTAASDLYENADTDVKPANTEPRYNDILNKYIDNKAAEVPASEQTAEVKTSDKPVEPATDETKTAEPVKTETAAPAEKKREISHEYSAMLRRYLDASAEEKKDNTPTPSEGARYSESLNRFIGNTETKTSETKDDFAAMLNRFKADSIISGSEAADGWDDFKSQIKTDETPALEEATVPVSTVVKNFETAALDFVPNVSEQQNVPAKAATTTIETVKPESIAAVEPVEETKQDFADFALFDNEGMSLGTGVAANTFTPTAADEEIDFAAAILEDLKSEREDKQTERRVMSIEPIEQEHVEPTVQEQPVEAVAEQINEQPQAEDFNRYQNIVQDSVELYADEQIADIDVNEMIPVYTAANLFEPGERSYISVNNATSEYKLRFRGNERRSAFTGMNFDIPEYSCTSFVSDYPLDVYILLKSIGTGKGLESGAINNVHGNRRMLYIENDDMVPGGMTAMQFLMYCLSEVREWSVAKQERVLNTFTRVGLESVAVTRTEDLSRTKRVMLLLIAALYSSIIDCVVLNIRKLVTDESEEQSFFDIIRLLHENGMTVLLAGVNHRLASAVSSRIVGLKNGQQKFNGSYYDFVSSYCKDLLYFETYDESIVYNIGQQLPEYTMVGNQLGGYVIRAELYEPSEIKRIIATLVNCGIDERTIVPVQKNFENAFENMVR